MTQPHKVPKLDEKVVLNLHKIFYKLGAYSQDHLQHAANVIESNSRLAGECMDLLGIELRPLEEVYKMDRGED